jgi:transcriptional regulator with GAF, ATPase, and Fis domain
VASPEDSDLARALADIARAFDTYSVHETLQRTVDLAVATIPGCDHAGVSVVHYGKISTPAASDGVALRVDAIQYEVGDGPCLDAIADEGIFQTDDLELESRWPRFSARAHDETAVASILAFRLFARERALGSLNLFSKHKAAFGPEARETGLLFAVHAAVALQASQRTEKLLAALETRDVIGEAKGILMEREHISVKIPLSDLESLVSSGARRRGRRHRPAKMPLVPASAPWRPRGEPARQPVARVWRGPSVHRLRHPDDPPRLG